MNRMLVDVGNSRLKWRKQSLGSTGWEDVSIPPRDVEEWDAVWCRWGLSSEPSEWAVSSVSPRLTELLTDWLRERKVTSFRFFTSGRDVPLRHQIVHPETSGADRAFGVLAALQMEGTAGKPGFVISCGSAITVDRVSSDGVWTGGAIAPGLSLAEEALHERTAQLPRVYVTKAPPSWGRSTVPAIEAGVFWGCVGTIRELISRQSEGFTQEPWIVWTGGDARVLSDAVAFRSSRWVPGLVLHGLQNAMGW